MVKPLHTDQILNLLSLLDYEDKVMCQNITNYLLELVFLSSEKCTILTSKNVPLEWLHIKN
jgi:hypothetical protein